MFSIYRMPEKGGISSPTKIIFHHRAENNNFYFVGKSYNLFRTPCTKQKIILANIRSIREQNPQAACCFLCTYSGWHLKVFDMEAGARGGKSAAAENRGMQRTRERRKKKEKVYEMLFICDCHSMTWYCWLHQVNDLVKWHCQIAAILLGSHLETQHLLCHCQWFSGL